MVSESYPDKAAKLKQMKEIQTKQTESYLPPA